MSTLMPGALVDAMDRLMTAKADPNQLSAARVKGKVTVKPKCDPSGATMKAVEWSGKRRVAVNTSRPKPVVTDPHDALIRVTSTALCGSDLHIYGGYMAGMSSGDVLGHEVMGVIDDVGADVKSVKKGDRVVVSFDLGCGECFYCRDGMHSSCEITNPSAVQEGMYGHRTAGALGYSHLTGGWTGAQAEFVRVPFADTNCLKLPPASELPDDKALFLSDILPTAWYANELADVKKGDYVAIWGAGPVGILAAQCAFARGARRVVLIDNVPFRLEFARKAVPRVETIDFSRESAEKQLIELSKDEPARAPDAAIDAVGMHYAHSFLHKAQMALNLETDSPEALNSCIQAVRKGGHIGIVGVYAGLANGVNLGALMEKGLRMGLGQTPVQRFWEDLLQKVLKGELDPSVVVTHRLDIEEAPDAYSKFDAKSDGVVKVMFIMSDEAGPRSGTLKADVKGEAKHGHGRHHKAEAGASKGGAGAKKKDDAKDVEEREREDDEEEEEETPHAKGAGAAEAASSSMTPMEEWHAYQKRALVDMSEGAGEQEEGQGETELSGGAQGQAQGEGKLKGGKTELSGGAQGQAQGEGKMMSSGGGQRAELSGGAQGQAHGQGKLQGGKAELSGGAQGQLHAEGMTTTQGTGATRGGVDDQSQAWQAHGQTGSAKSASSTTTSSMGQSQSQGQTQTMQQGQGQGQGRGAQASSSKSATTSTSGTGQGQSELQDEDAKWAAWAQGHKSS